MNISIIGTGYVGLVSGACMADRGHNVVCVDNVPQKVEQINSGCSPIHEEGLDDLLTRNVGSRLFASVDLREAVLESDITFIAVGTPFDGQSIDLQFIDQVSRSVGEALAVKDGYHVVVVKSTVVPGTTDTRVREQLEKYSGKKVGRDFGIGMNPEFLTEGTAIRDFMYPDRLVIGANDERATAVIRQVYDVFEFPEIIETNCRTAEMIKYASNSVLATMISFSNEIAALCRSLGDIDVADVMRGVHAATYFTSRGTDGELHRAGISSFLWAGCGFGGSCLPKDVQALIAQGRERGVSMRLLASVIEINRAQPAEVLSIVQQHGRIEGKDVAVLGLAFKPDTDDIRESPAFPIIDLLLSAGARVRAYDPVAADNARRALQGRTVSFVDSLAEAVQGADVVILVTSWAEFEHLADYLPAGEAQPLVFDGRRVLDKLSFERYTGIGI